MFHRHTNFSLEYYEKEQPGLLCDYDFLKMLIFLPSGFGQKTKKGTKHSTTKLMRSWFVW